MNHGLGGDTQESRHPGAREAPRASGRGRQLPCHPVTLSPCHPALPSWLCRAGLSSSGLGGGQVLCEEAMSSLPTLTYRGRNWPADNPVVSPKGSSWDGRGLASPGWMTMAHLVADDLRAMCLLEPHGGAWGAGNPVASASELAGVLAVLSFQTAAGGWSSQYCIWHHAIPCHVRAHSMEVL